MTSPFRGRYESYKGKQAVVIGWLTETAHKCCKLDETIVALRSRAGKLAKQNGDTVPLKTNEILLLCKKIAEKKKVKIPDYILALLSSVISLRMSAAAVYVNQPPTQDRQLQQSNNGHTYFIGILHQARDVLSAVEASRITTRTTAKPVFQSKTLWG